MTGEIQFESDGPVALVTLSHPGKLNAMSREMWRDLRALFIRIQASTQWRCVIVRGEGGHFCAGGDISEYPGFRFDEESLRHFHEVEVWGGLQAMLDCDVPLLAQIEGACMGAGLEIASCCDLRLADASAKFGAPIARLGFPMAPREAKLLARTAGLLTAREMLLQAAVLDASQMQQRGFLNRVIAGGQVRQEALEGARRIAALAPQAARANKRLLRAISEENQAPVPAQWAQHATETIANAYRYADGPEHREGIAAFLEKRKPAF